MADKFESDRIESNRHQKDWWDARIEAYVDDMLPDDESTELGSRLKQDKMLSAEVVMAERIRTEFRAMDIVNCPASVSRDIKRTIRRENRHRVAERWIRRVQWALGGYRKFALAGLLLIAVAVLLERGPGTESPDVIAAASVEQALDDVKWTLALLSDAGSNVAGTVRSDVVEPLLIDRWGSTLDVLTETQN